MSEKPRSLILVLWGDLSNLFGGAAGAATAVAAAGALAAGAAYYAHSE